MKTLLPRFLSDRAAASAVSCLLAGWVSVAFISNTGIGGDLVLALL